MSKLIPIFKKISAFLITVSLLASFFNVNVQAGGYEYFSNFTPSYCNNVATTAIYYLIQPNSIANCYSQYVYQQACDPYNSFQYNCNPTQTNCVQNNNFYSNNACIVANNYCDASFYSGRVDNVGIEKNKSSGVVNFDVLGMISSTCNNQNLVNPVPVFVNVYDKNNNKIVDNEWRNVSVFQNCASNSRSCQNFRLSVSMNYSQFVNNTFRVTVGFLPNTSMPSSNNVVVGDYQKTNTTNYEYNNNYNYTDFYNNYDYPVQYLPVYDNFPVIPFYTPSNSYEYQFDDNCLINTYDYYGVCPIIY